MGHIPNLWGISKLKFFAEKVSSGKTPSGGGSVYVSSGVMFLRSQNIYDDGLRLDDVVYISKEIDKDLSSSRVSPNDVLLNITGASIGRTCIVPKNFSAANVNQHVCIIRVPEKSLLSPAYLSMLLKASFSKKYFDYIQNGSGREGLNFEQIRNLTIPVPPLHEQEKIVCAISKKLEKIDILVKAAYASISLLKERRSSLISAAVTGKINVRGLA
nr:restriction endonuclease subunit S [Polynucleobacter sp. 30F-ANTBAC]